MKTFKQKEEELAVGRMLSEALAKRLLGETLSEQEEYILNINKRQVKEIEKMWKNIFGDSFIKEDEDEEL